MGVAGHQNVLVAFALADEDVEQLFDGFGYLLNLCAGEEFQVEQHLVVARASAVYLLAYIAQAAGQHQFHLRVYVFHSVFYHEFSFFGLRVDVLQRGKQLFQFVGSQQADAFEHGDVGHGAKYVVLGQVEVHFTVASHREAFDVFVYLNGFLPKFLSHILY